MPADSEVLDRMRADWNARAGEDAYYYVAFGRREQGHDEFFSTAADVLRLLIAELKRLQNHEAALEIGCGPGRLMRPLAPYFGKIHGVDVSEEMVRLANQNLKSTPNAYAHETSGTDLSLFPTEKFDFVYSYAVFQHIPSRDVVFEYLREARRVLRTGGILRCQINGLPAHSKQYDTWSGVRIAPEEITAFAREYNLQLLALEQIWTQYMWITCRKMADGWTKHLETAADQIFPLDPAPSIHRISNALTGEAAAPATGPMAAISIRILNLPPDCDLNHMAITADDRACRLTYIGDREADGLSQVNAALPEGIRTGLVKIEVMWLGRPLCPPAWVRIVPAGPAVPRVHSVTDGINLLSGTRIASRVVKVTMLDVMHPDRFRVAIDGQEITGSESFCVDPIFQHYEYNVMLPESVTPGPHRVEISIGKRAFAPVAVEVV
ncbi:MAG TPA: methyltransferase domain-containing protein [Bryobacteraceae bacterium]|nr:methyltransferase domain-containing protein [Bryobacteraceae bacterium]